jgi:pyruvate/2-oxoglutarate dehydrogenase complex dihydrolipoamide dehydrogenase (E3) component
MSKTYDLAIIGGGAAGLIAAPFAVQLGARVALLEKDRIGGDCTWMGCVPSKTLLKAAKLAHQMRTADRYGLSPTDPAVDLKSVMGHVLSVIEEIYHYTTPEELRRHGTDVFLGEPRFLDSHTLSVGETTLTAHNVLLATGAHPFIPPITGLDGVNYLTYQSIWNLEVLPDHLAVIGAGPIGCEMAQAFRRLGARVTLLEAGDRLLPRDDSSASRLLAEVFTTEGIDLRFNVTVERVWQDGDSINLVAGGQEIACNALLAAVGRRPNVEGLELQKAGVHYSEHGIQVDDYLHTSQQHIYAAGDCIGSYQFAHYAGWQGFLAVRNALLLGASKGVAESVPWATFTDPEVAHVGLTEEEAHKKLGDEVMSYEWPMNRVDRALNEGERAGFLKVVYQKNGTLLGVTIVAERAGEMIHEWVVALKHGFKVGALARVIHVYPTYSIASMQAAAAIQVERLLDGLSGRLIRTFAHLTR